MIDNIASVCKALLQNSVLVHYFTAVYWEFLKFSSNRITLVLSVYFITHFILLFLHKISILPACPGDWWDNREKLFFSKYSLVNYSNYWVLALILRANCVIKSLLCLQTTFWEAKMKKMWTFAWRKRCSSLVRMQWWNNKPFDKLPSLKKKLRRWKELILARAGFNIQILRPRALSPSTRQTDQKTIGPFALTRAPQTKTQQLPRSVEGNHLRSRNLKRCVGISNPLSFCFCSATRPVTTCSDSTAPLVDAEVNKLLSMGAA